jgi:hypothetical protein
MHRPTRAGAPLGPAAVVAALVMGGTLPGLLQKVKPYRK